MTMLKKKFLFTTLVSILLTACASGPQPGESSSAQSKLPHWVLKPEVEGTVAEAACVIASGAFNVDRSEAIHFASEQLAAQMERNVAFLGKGFQSKTRSTQGLNVGTDFNQSGRQLVEQSLSGLKAVETGIYPMNGQDQVCVLVALDRSVSEQFYQQMKTLSGATLSADDDAVLYEQFRAYKADQALQKAREVN